jgi:preprotein translocase subunit SecB
MDKKIKIKGKPLGKNGATLGANPGGTKGGTHPTDTQPMVMYKGQYVKNIDFNGPGLYRQVKGEPKTNLSFDIKTIQLEPGIYEVDLSVKAEVTTDKEKIVTLTVGYGVLYQLTNIPKDKQENVLISEGGRIVFPYIQRLVADIMREGGLPPFQLPPIDFTQAYRQSKK